ncbi:hypothetical protein N7532_010632 [Penicillium argentinense]|uniref:Uncharacterized protein n=1 Tax=Penicillium argentinense TaxID=1131581 RepID=A0A9W9JYB4_9EURO|nr:uncharacterized protein N7532_010632 [Penicillium argentinense]KAJ5085861.1 hypothetical protein N7532_010632 [Penicillium argentinense]
MNLKTLFLGLSLGFLATNALPQGEKYSLKSVERSIPEAGEDATHISHLFTRDDNDIFGKVTTAVGRAASDDCNENTRVEGLYVPQEWAGWIPAEGNKWVRYNCAKAEYVETSTFRGKVKTCKKQTNENKSNVNVPRAIVTDGLATCMSIMAVSNAGTLMTHVSPPICSIISQGIKDASSDAHKQAQGLRNSIVALRKEYLPDMSGVKMVVVQGPYNPGVDAGSDGTKERARKAIAELFQVELDNAMYTQINNRELSESWVLEAAGGGRTASVEYVDGRPRVNAGVHNMEFNAS